MPRDDSAPRPETPPPRPAWTTADYMWAAAAALPLLACGPFLVAPPLWISTLIAHPNLPDGRPR